MHDFFYQHLTVGIIRITGEDAEDYLQSQLTIDLRKLSPGQVRFGLRLNSKGKILAGAHILRLGEEEYILFSQGLEAQGLISLLEENVVADEVEFEDESENWACLTLGIEKLGNFLPKLGNPSTLDGKIIKLEDGFIFKNERFQENVFFLILKKNSPHSSSLTNDLKEISMEEYEFFRMQAGCFSIPCEIGPNELPQEAGLEKLFVDFNKGCYLGQEVMARLHSMGQVQRKTVTVEWQGYSESPPNLPMRVLINQKNTGTLKALTKLGKQWIGVATIHQKGIEQLGGTGLNLEDESFGKITKL